MHPIDVHARRVFHEARADALKRTMLADAPFREEPTEPAEARIGPRLITTIQRPLGYRALAG